VVTTAFDAIEAIPGSIMHRRELWREMARSIRAFGAGGYTTLADAAWGVRERGRSSGRRVEHRTVSRTVLVKGLEFDHAVVLNADDHDGANLYVALTRASRTLTVLSGGPTLTPSLATQSAGRATRTRRPSARPASP
jgi:DNA helicase-2/ATP-dependent DNA helicase PcrA